MVYTQFNTQATQGTKTKFFEFIVNFYDKYEQKFIKNNPALLTQNNDALFKDNCRRFFDMNSHNDGKKYKYMFKDLAVKAAEDGGEFVLKVLKSFVVLIPYADADEIHRFYILSNCWQFFESDNLEIEYLLELSSLFKDEAIKVSPDCQKRLFDNAMSMVRSGAIVGYRSMQLIVNFSSLAGNKDRYPDPKDLYLMMLTECKAEGTKAVAEVIRANEEYIVFHNFANDFLKNGLGGSADVQKDGFFKLNSFWRDFTEHEIHDIVTAFCNHWAEPEAAFLCKLDDEIAEFATVVHRHPTVGKALVKLFKKDNYLRKSVFAIVVQIVLMTSQRDEAEVSKNVAATMTRLWSFADDLKTDCWIRYLITDLKLSDVTAKFETIISAINDSKQLANTLAPGILNLAFLLIESGSKKNDLKVTEGKLEKTRNNVAFIGRWLLVDTVTAHPKSSICESLLRSIVDCIFTHSSNHNVTFILIDALIEIRAKMVNEMVDNWEAFEKLTQNIWVFPSDVAVKIMAALMPIINRHQGMRKQIFETLRVHVLSPAKVETALPVMLQLLRSLTEQPESKLAFQCSQSLATFSSQLSVGRTGTGSSDVVDTIQIFECIKRCLHQSPVTKCLVYRGIVDICKKNNFFALQGLDLLANEVKKLPELKMANYVHRITGGTVLKHPVPYLLKAVTSLTAVVVHLRENNPPAGCTQVIDNGLKVVNSVDQAVDMYIASVLRLDLEDLDVDKMNEVVMKSNVINIQRLFGIMLVDLYDVIIEHLWTPDIGEDAVVLRNLANIVSKRRKLVDILDCKTKGKEDTVITRLSGIGLGDLQVDVPKLTAMLVSVNNPLIANVVAYDNYSLLDLLFEWLMLRIIDAAHSLDVKSASAIASQKALSELTKNLVTVYNDTDVPEDATLEVKKVWSAARTKCIEAFSIIFRYILTKYDGRCIDSLESILKVAALNQSVASLPHTQSAQTQRNLLNIATRPPPQATTDDASEPGFNKRFRIAATNYIHYLYDQCIPAIVSVKQHFEAIKCMHDYQKQMLAFISVGKKLSSMFTSTADRQRHGIYTTMMTGAKKYDFGDKLVTIEYWKTAMDLVIKSTCDDLWMTNLGSLMEDIVELFEVDEDQNMERSYVSMNKQWAPAFVIIMAQTLSSLYSKVSRIFDIKLETGEPLDDAFFAAVLEIILSISKVVESMIKIDVEIIRKDENMWTHVVDMLTDMYKTMNCVVLKMNALVAVQVDLDDWTSLQSLSDLCTNTVNGILGVTKHAFGTVTYSDNKKTKDKAQMLVKKARRDEKLFVRYEKELEGFHIGLMLLENKYGMETRPLKFLAAENRTYRDFKINYDSIEGLNDD